MGDTTRVTPRRRTVAARADKTVAELKQVVADTCVLENRLLKKSVTGFDSEAKYMRRTTSETVELPIRLVEGGSVAMRQTLRELPLDSVDLHTAWYHRYTQFSGSG